MALWKIINKYNILCCCQVTSSIFVGKVVLQAKVQYD
jgi:hypothetical protein